MIAARRALRRRVVDPENATWVDLKECAWGLLLLVPFIAVFAYGARVLVGPREAFWLGLGLIGVAIVAWGSVIAASLAMSYGYDAAMALRRWLRSRRDLA